MFAPESPPPESPPPLTVEIYTFVVKAFWGVFCFFAHLIRTHLASGNAVKRGNAVRWLKVGFFCLGEGKKELMGHCRQINLLKLYEICCEVTGD